MSVNLSVAEQDALIAKLGTSGSTGYLPQVSARVVYTKRNGGKRTSHVPVIKWLHILDFTERFLGCHVLQLNILNASVGTSIVFGCEAKLGQKNYNMIKIFAPTR